MIVKSSSSLSTGMIRDFLPRLYQQTIFHTAVHSNTLVVLPTGLGKTSLAFLLAAHRLRQYPSSKILFLAPTKPLCHQHLQTFQRHLNLPENSMALFTGDVSPEKRAELWKNAQVIISTPQGLENDIINKRIKLEEVSLLVLDEAHHATGEYAYVWIAQQYEKNCSFPRILALTASPGSDIEKIKELCHHLHIEKVEVRTENDPDVQSYVQPITVQWLKVPFPEEFKIVQKYLQECRQNKLKEVQNYGCCRSSSLTKGELLGLQQELLKKVSSGDRDFAVLRSISLTAEALKVEHALELLETQGIKQLRIYFAKLFSEASSSPVKAIKNLVSDPLFKSAFFLAEKLEKHKHPKLAKLQEAVLQEIKKNEKTKIIIFTQFRDSAEEIVQELDAAAVKSQIFVGQAKKKGLGFSQKQQKEILNLFRDGKFNVLVATSVAEEGLDIPKVDRVIFYEPVPSAIRSIQRRGRTGRLEEGAVTILATAGTRDEAYYWSSRHKEKQMFRNLEKLKKEFSFSSSLNNAGGGADAARKEKSFLHSTLLHPTLSSFIPEEQVVAVLADHREKGNRIIKELIELGISVKTAQLESADYVISGKVGIELKKVPDFIASIIDGRILDQICNLKKNFEKSVLIIEGEEDIFSLRNIHENAIRGMLASIVLDFRMPILCTKNPKATAALLAVMAKREQDKSRDFSYHERKPHFLPEQQEFFISAIPNIGTVQARRLLSHFGSVRQLVNATKEELLSIEGIGEKTAEKLLSLFNEKYSSKYSSKDGNKYQRTN